jgi:hypothetical protein
MKIWMFSRRKKGDNHNFQGLAAAIGTEETTLRDEQTNRSID